MNVLFPQLLKEHLHLILRERPHDGCTAAPVSTAQMATLQANCKTTLTSHVTDQPRAPPSPIARRAACLHQGRRSRPAFVAHGGP